MKRARLILVILLVAAVSLFFSLFPHWHAFKNSPEGYAFSGQASWFDPWDINVYWAAIRWGQDHGFLMANMYDSHPNPPILYYPLYTTTGWLFKNTQPALLFYSLSIITSLILATVVVIICYKLFRDTLSTFFTSLVIALGGGLGFMVAPHSNSLDLSMTSFTFHSAWQRPHEALALASYLVALIAIYQLLKNKQLIWVVISVLSLIVTLVFYPYYLLSWFLIVGLAVILWRSQLNVKTVIVLGSISIFGAAITWLMYFNLSLNPSFTGVVTQTLTNPTIPSLLLGYGVLILAPVAGLFYLPKLTQLEKFLLGWIWISLALSFLPLGIARFYLRGLFMPIVLLNILLLKKLCKQYLPQQAKSMFKMCLVSLLILTSMSNWAIFYTRIQEVDAFNPWYYFTQEEEEALKFIDQELPSNSTFLSAYHIGNHLPAFTSAQVFFGHLIQTPNAKQRSQQVARFYSWSMSEQEAVQFLQTNHVKYVYLGREEREFVNAEKDGSLTVSLSRLPFLEKIYQNQLVEIYQLTE